MTMKFWASGCGVCKILTIYYFGNTFLFFYIFNRIRCKIRLLLLYDSYVKVIHQQFTLLKIPACVQFLTSPIEGWWRYITNFTHFNFLTLIHTYTILQITMYSFLCLCSQLTHKSKRDLQIRTGVFLYSVLFSSHHSCAQFAISLCIKTANKAEPECQWTIQQCCGCCCVSLSSFLSVCLFFFQFGFFFIQ